RNTINCPCLWLCRGMRPLMASHFTVHAPRLTSMVPCLSAKGGCTGTRPLIASRFTPHAPRLLLVVLLPFTAQGVFKEMNGLLHAFKAGVDLDRSPQGSQGGPGLLELHVRLPHAGQRPEVMGVEFDDVLTVGDGRRVLLQAKINGGPLIEGFGKLG